MPCSKRHCDQLRPTAARPLVQVGNPKVDEGPVAVARFWDTGLHVLTLSSAAPRRLRMDGLTIWTFAPTEDRSGAASPNPRTELSAGQNRSSGPALLLHPVESGAGATGRVGN